MRLELWVSNAVRAFAEWNVMYINTDEVGDLICRHPSILSYSVCVDIHHVQFGESRYDI